MKLSNHGLWRVGALLGLAAGLASSATAASLINAAGTVALGVNPAGHLNVPDVYNLAANTTYLGIARSFRPGDATAPGCLCEGWGVSASGNSGWANQNEGGVHNLSVVSFTTDDAGGAPGTFATSKVNVTSLSHLEVTQAYTRSTDTGNAFQDLVTIKNTSATETLDDVKYVRVMDWDVPPTEFSEFVSIKGTGTTTELERSHDNGFNTANPLGGDAALDPSTVDTDFTDVGPADHGAYFRFAFGDLAPGEEKTFKIFYGAGEDEADAMASLAALAPELYSVGKSRSGGVPNNDSAVYFFAFKGVGGEIITPPVPDGGSTLGMLALALVGLVSLGRRRN